MPVRRLFLVCALIAAGQDARAQVPATNDVASCTLLADPTAQRLCLESARNSRPASTFDPTAQKQRSERRRAPGRDALSPAAKAAPSARSGTAPDPASAGAATEAYRDTKWRLQIP